MLRESRIKRPKVSAIARDYGAAGCERRTDDRRVSGADAQTSDARFDVVSRGTQSLDEPSFARIFIKE